MVLANKKIADAVLREAKQAALRDQVLTEYCSSLPNYREEMDRLGRIGFDPMAWLDVVSVPAAFSVDGTRASEKLLEDVFKYCDLDPGKPRHWRILVDALVNQCFRAAGAPQKWNEEGLFDLLCDIRDLQKRFPGAIENVQLANLLSKKQPYKAKYQAIGTETLRKLVGKALNPSANPTAAIAEDQDFVAVRAEQARRKLGLPSALGVAIQQKILEEYHFDLARQKLEELARAAGRAFTEAD